MNNEITTQPEVNTLAKAQTDFMSNVLADLKKMKCAYTPYGKICGLNVLAEINHLLVKEGKNLNDDDVDQLSVISAVQFAMMSELNVANKELFVQFRNVSIKTGKSYKEGSDWKQASKWIKTIECKPQYKGQMKLITKFGVGIDKVYPIWIVREGDDFTYASFKGVEMTPPSWSPKSYTAPVVRVVVPVKYKDGDIQYHIAEKESLATNIKAQIKQALLGIDDKDTKIRLGVLMKDMSLEELLYCKGLTKYINNTYTGISKEEMYITKLVLNATKRITIDYGNAYVRELAEQTYDNADVYVDSHNAREIVEETDLSATPELSVSEEEPEAISYDDNGEVVEKKTDSVSLDEFLDDQPF